MQNLDTHTDNMSVKSRIWVGHQQGARWKGESNGGAYDQSTLYLCAQVAQCNQLKFVKIKGRGWLEASI
jgi:hypothetical protein